MTTYHGAWTWWALFGSLDGDYYQPMGVMAAVGRTVTSGEDRLPAAFLIGLSCDFRVNRFALDTNVLGQSLTINGYTLTVR